MTTRTTEEPILVYFCPRCGEQLETHAGPDDGPTTVYTCTTVTCGFRWAD